jgi:integrase
MPRQSTGTVRILNNDDGHPQWHAKWTRADGSRSEWLPLSPKIAIYDTAGARREAARLAPRVRRESVGKASTETVEAYSKRWLDDRDGRVNSIRDDRSRMRDHVLPTLRALDVRTFARDDIEHLRDLLDDKITKGDLAWKTVASVWTLVTSMCDDMLNAKKRELRVRSDNPCRDVKPPERGERRARQYLFPSEFLTFVSCERVPLRWRRAVALAIYTYTRDGELRVLRWDGGDVDLEHGVLSITRAYNRRTATVKGTKTGHSRRFAIEPNLLSLLQAMHDEREGKGVVIDLPSERAMARNLRRWLWKANVHRPELHEGSPTRKSLTWHDLRATGATWMAVRGDDPLKIKQRCGHTTFSTTELYVREAEAVREGFGDPFPALPPALLGIAPNRPGRFSRSRSSQKQAVLGGVDGTRTRGLRRDRPAL